MALLWVSAIVAGGVGACVRYLVSVWLSTPGWAVLLVNGAGSVLVGVVLGVTGLEGAPFAADVSASMGAGQLVLLSGFAGGLTTFSTFSVETVTLAENKLPWRAAGFAAANILVGFAAAGLAYAVVSSVVN